MEFKVIPNALKTLTPSPSPRSGEKGAKNFFARNGQRFWPFSSVTVLAWGVLLALGAVVQAEELVIDLTGGQNDPLIEFVPPPPGSPDRVRFTNKGLLIQQKADVRGRSTGITGFKSMLSASGDFTIQLDAKVIRLDAPSDGWGQGLIFAVFLDDEKQTTLKLNYIAYSGRPPTCMVEISGRGVDVPAYLPLSVPFKEGTLIVQRDRDQAIFSVDVGNGPEEHARFPCPTDDVRSVEVWSTRLAKGNAPAELLIKRLTIDADSFYSFKQRGATWFTWWRVFVAVQAIFAIGLFAFMVRPR